MRIALAMLACAAMTRAQAPATVAGRVTDESGQPLKKATVVLSENVLPRESIRTSYSASTGADGSFLFDNLNPARYQVTVERAGYLPSAVTINGPGYEGSLLTAAAGAHLN